MRTPRKRLYCNIDLQWWGSGCRPPSSSLAWKGLPVDLGQLAAGPRPPYLRPVSHRRCTIQNTWRRWVLQFGQLLAGGTQQYGPW